MASNLPPGVTEAMIERHYADDERGIDEDEALDAEEDCDTAEGRLIAAIEEACSHLGAALMQSLTSDNQIIMNRVRKAQKELKTAWREWEKEKQS